MNRAQRRAARRAKLRGEWTAGELVSADMEFPCPFCGAGCAISASSGALVHGLPTCATFTESEVLEFMQKVNAFMASRGA